jgi:hypothetical protein
MQVFTKAQQNAFCNFVQQETGHFESVAELRQASDDEDCVLDLEGKGDFDGLMYYTYDEVTCFSNGTKFAYMCGEAQGWECWQGEYWCEGDNVYEEGVQVRIYEEGSAARDFATWEEFANYVLSK